MTLPRTAFDDLDPEVRDLLAPKVERLGYLGEFFQVAAAQPVALAGFIRFTDGVKAALPNDLTELVALTVATATGNAYERVQHERLALKLGFDAAWVLEVESLDPAEPEHLDQRQAAVQRLVLAMVRTLGRGAADELAAVEQHLEPEVVVAVLLTVCRYLGHAAVANTLGLAAPVASPFPEEPVDPPAQGAHHG